MSLIDEIPQGTDFTIKRELYAPRTEGTKTDEKILFKEDILQKRYDNTRKYNVDEVVVFNDTQDDIYICLAETSAGESPLTTPAKWNLVSASSSGGGIFSKVGIDGDYETISEAVADGKLNLILISDVTEIADPDLNSYTGEYFVLDLNGNALFMSNYSFLGVGYFYNVYNGTIHFSYNSIKGLFVSTDSDKNEINRVIFQNSSTVSGSYVAHRCVVQNCTFNLPNNSGGALGYSTASRFFIGKVYNCQFTGAGSSSNLAIYNDTVNEVYINDIIIDGTWQSSGNFNNTTGNIFFTKIVCTVSTTLFINITSLRDLHDANNIVFVKTTSTSDRYPCYCESVKCKNISMVENGTINNCIITNSSTTFVNQNVSVSNSTFVGTLTLNTDYIKLVNVKVDTLVISGNINYITNVEVETSVTISGDFNAITNMSVGSANLGTKTITINASADKTRIQNTTTEAAIVDNGTNSYVDVNSNLLF